MVTWTISCHSSWAKMAANVQSLVQYWKNFNLPRLQKELDDTATDIANRQDESDASRKKLVELSREFKNGTPEDIRRAVAPLLKSFQAEVDSLSKRSKAAEAAFLEVYRNVIEVPDPVPCLEQCEGAQKRAMRAQDLEIENKQLRDTLNEYNEEFKDVRNQEVTIKQLKERLKEFEGKVESTAQARTKDIEKELQREFSEKEHHLHDSHLAVVKNLEEAERKVSELQSALECTQSELFDFRAKYDEDSLAKSDEMEIVMNDLERANQRAAIAEKEVEQLKEQLAAVKHSLQLADQIQKAPDMEQAVEVLARSSLEVELAAKEKEISQLVDDIQRLQSTINTLKETSASQIAQLEEMLFDKNKIIQRLEEKLELQKDYEEIKKELNILKSMEFPDNEQESGRESPKSPKHLEVLLLEKNKTLQSENTVLKAAKTELSSTPPLPGTQFPHPLQTVESFGSFLGEEIVSTLLKREDNNRSPLTPKSTDDTRSSTGPPDNMSCNMLTKHVPHSPELPPKEMVSESVSIGKLQECLRLNIDKYANETLNTLNISRCVRELLSVHNIGQRLFAKFVLGLSQGTVSELLSKPKPWDKLTEKGRDSYRKMHAWAYDETCINMLKALVPRKGKEISLPSLRQEDAVAEERIVQILNEANLAMVTTNKENKMLLHNGNNNNNNTFLEQKMTNHNTAEDSRGDSGGNEPIGGSERRVLLHNNNNNFLYTMSRRAKKYEHDDISHEMVSRIYQQELTKLLGQHGEDGFRQRDGYERTQDEIRQALTIYHQELARLSQLSPLTSSESFRSFAAAAAAAASAFPHGVLMNGSYANMLPGNVSPSERQDVPIDATVTNRGRHQSERQESDALRHHGSAFSLVRPKVEPASSPNKQVSSYPQISGSPTGTPGALMNMVEGPDDLSTSASPLQRMQSITNSLLSQSSMPTMPSAVSRPTKAVLPPITQQQFDQYNNLNTEDIVKKVKEQLSQYSISQRLFGESVLGLSQGSVSDLLARPKPWHMLTQKGREPFIRMKIFLEDDNAVHKLVASQYKIAPEKLMRTGNYTGVTNPIVSGSANKGNVRSLESGGMPHKPMDVTHSANSGFTQHSEPARSCSPSPEVHNVPLPPNATPLNSCMPSGQVHNNGRRSHHSSRSPSYMQPSVYEMAALTTDLDTQSITSKIKETLMAHNIGQKIFGEAVLGLSQGSVSELLSKPKPWHMLSIKGREPFIRMQLWLSDPHNVEKLQAIKNQRREANKRRRNTDYSDACTPQQPTFSFNFTPPSFPASKKPRVLFTEEQKEALRLAFSMDPYPSTGTIEFLASELGLSIRTITNWFHNHRMRLKQNASPNPDDPKLPSSDSVMAITSSILPGVREGATFDPVQFRTLLNRRLSDLQCQKGMQFSAGGFSYLYPMYRNCSPDSSGHADDMGTLDLSMSSQYNSKCESVSSAKSDMCGDDHSSSDMNEDSSFSQEQGNTEGSDHESVDEASSTMAPSEAEKRSVNFSMSGTIGSNRRKRAMPQWVDPGLEFSPNSDVNSDESEDDEAVASGHEIINGVCVRQTDGFDLRIPREETVRIEPVPAPDHELATVRSRDRTKFSDVAGDGQDRLPESYSGVTDSQSMNMRQENIKRLEKSVSEQEESWGCSEDDYEDDCQQSGSKKAQQRIEKTEKEDWEF